VTSVWFDTVLLSDGWASCVRVSHSRGVVTAIEKGVAAGPEDERAAIGVPGLGNLHSHAFQRGMAGLAERRAGEGDDFWSWRQTMYQFVDRLGPEDVEAIAALSYAEMLESGFTRVGEFHYLHHDRDGAPYGDRAELAARIGAAADGAGIGLTLLPVFYAHSGFGGEPARPEQRRFINTLDSYASLVEGSRRAVGNLADAVVGVAPHSLRAVSPDELALVTPLAGEGPVHIHIAEQTREVEDCLAWSGRRPVEWLLDNAEVDARWCLVHATHLTDAETDRLARGPAVVGLCPITEANLGDGLFPAGRFMEGGGRFGVGSDSNVLIDAAEELRLLDYGQRLVHLKRNVLASSECPSVGGTLFRAALAGGAQALGVGQGGIRVGASADMVSLDAAQPSLTGRGGDALLDGWLFAARGGAVDNVWRRGRKVVAGGRHLRKADLVQAFARTLNRVLRA
jgi:formimidoylglutamate deiminase